MEKGTKSEEEQIVEKIWMKALAHAVEHDYDLENNPVAEAIETARDNGFGVVYGASDDLMEFRGAIHDESSCYEGGEVFFYRDGIPLNERKGADAIIA